MKNIETLNEIINYQSSPFIKIGLGYDEKQNTPEESANTNNTKPSEKDNEEDTKNYANILKGSINNDKGNSD